jgi:hypothetical protein
MQRLEHTESERFRERGGGAGPCGFIHVPETLELYDSLHHFHVHGTFVNILCTSLAV